MRRIFYQRSNRACKNWAFGREFPTRSVLSAPCLFWTDLISSANRGCELCELINQGFTETVVEEGYWEEYTLEDAIWGIESEGFSTGLKICINTSHLYSAEALEHVKLFDSILVQAGTPEPYGDNVEYRQEFQEWSISDPLGYLYLELSVPRG